MSFKENVEFYLKYGKNKSFNYYGFDIANDSIAEEDEDNKEASVKTKKEKKCPKCGKEPCECDASMRTGTHGEEDDDGWHASTQTKIKGGDDDDDDKCCASTGTPPKDFGATPEEIEMIKLIRKNGGFGGSFKPETPEEVEMLKLAKSWTKKSTKASVKDDKGAGYAPACKTSNKNLKEEILKRL